MRNDESEFHIRLLVMNGDPALKTILSYLYPTVALCILVGSRRSASHDDSKLQLFTNFIEPPTLEIHTAGNMSFWVERSEGGLKHQPVDL